MRITARDLPLVVRVLVRTYGWRGIGRRITYELSHRSGHLARVLPAEDRLTLAEPGWSWPLRFDIDEIRRGYERLDELDAIREEVVADAERVLAGEMKFYGWTWKRTEWPPRWHVNPWTGYEYPREHWTRISDFQPVNGDIKDVWEMSRLPFTYLFARAWVLTGDDRYPEAWWRAVEDWAEHNAPNRGVNWKCGQETSLRGIALQFGLMTFAQHPSTTPQRHRLAGGILQASVGRLLPTLRYALSQRNNHAISEAVFLETMAVAGEADPDVGRSARRALDEAVDDQFYDDGWYAQHSFNYQRLALHTLLWLDRVRSAAGLAPHGASHTALRHSTTLLCAAQEPTSGWLPNIGPNDGALLFPLTTCSHRDFRPLLRTIRTGVGTEGPWSEESLWLDPGVRTEGPNATVADRHIFRLAGPRSHMVVRAGHGRHRLHHVDLLHVDLWIDGHNLLADPGTFRYAAPAPWGNALANRAVHNVPVSDYCDRRLGRFLPLSWPTADCVRHETVSEVEVLELRAQIGGSSFRRTIVRRHDRYAIVDHAGGAPFAARWTLGTSGKVALVPGAAEITTAVGYVAVHGGVEVLVPEEGDPLSGWIADNYSARRPTTALICRSPGSPLVAIAGPVDVRGPQVDVEGITSGRLTPDLWLT